MNKNIRKHILDTLSILGGRATTKDLRELWEGEPWVTEQYDWNPYRVQQQVLKRMGEIDIDKSGKGRAVWYLK